MQTTLCVKKCLVFNCLFMFILFLKKKVEIFKRADELVINKDKESASNDSTGYEYEHENSFTPFHFTKND